jgi:hypothetical protein
MRLAAILGGVPATKRRRRCPPSHAFRSIDDTCVDAWGGATVIRNAAARQVLLGVVLITVLGLAAGLASALATSPSPSPAGERIVLKVGWLTDPANLNPFVFAPASASEVRLLNYDSLVGLDAATLTPMDGAKSTGFAADWSVGPTARIGPSPHVTMPPGGTVTGR